MSRPNGGPDLSTLLGFGLTLAALLVVCLGLGWLIDTALGSLPVFTLVGLVLGVAGASIYVYVQFKRFFKE